MESAIPPGTREVTVKELETQEGSAVMGIKHALHFQA